MSDIQRVKEATDIVDLVSQYVTLEPAGTSGHKARCPFHQEKSPSFNVSSDRQMYYCFGCQKGGDVISFIQEIESMDFGEALRHLAERAGITLSGPSGNQESSSKKELLLAINNDASMYWQVALRKSEAGKEYLLSRGLSRETIIEWQLGYASPGRDGLVRHLLRKGHDGNLIEELGLGYKRNGMWVDRFRERVMFPLFDSQGRIVGFTGRLFLLPDSTTDPKSTGKYVNSKESALFDKSRLLYGLHNAKKGMREHDRCVLVEGQMDLLMAHQSGVTETVAVSGTSLTKDHVQSISRFTDLILLAYDGDEAGHRSMKKAAAIIYQEGLFAGKVLIPKDQDPALIEVEEPGSFKKLVNKASDFLDSEIEVLKQSESSNRLKTRDARESLYPLLLYIEDPMLRDTLLGKIAKALGVTLEATLEDFRSWKSKKASQVSHDQSRKTEYEETTDAPQGLSTKEYFCGCMRWVLTADMSYDVRDFLELYESILDDIDPERRLVDVWAFQVEQNIAKKEDIPIIIQELSRRINTLVLADKRKELLQELRTGPPDEEQLLSDLDSINKQLESLEISS